MRKGRQELRGVEGARKGGVIRCNVTCIHTSKCVGEIEYVRVASICVSIQCVCMCMNHSLHVYRIGTKETNKANDQRAVNYTLLLLASPLALCGPCTVIDRL